MLRRFTACLLALLMLATVPAHAAEVDDLAILSQYDERFFSNDFRYNDNYFRYGGCGPSSIANGLIAALGVTDQDLATGIFRDVLYLLAGSNPSVRAIQVASLNALNFDGTIPKDFSEQYPSLSAALGDFGGACRYVDGYLTAESLQKLLMRTYTGRQTLYHSSINRANHWETLCAIADMLMNMNLEDGVIVVAFQGAGTVSTAAPFRSGTSGHYLSLYIQVKEFCESGAFYVLDSFPRALEGEAYGSNLPYATTYDFVGKQTRYLSLTPFNELFEVERVQPTIIRVQPCGEALAAANFATRLGAYVVNSLLPYLNRVVLFFGTPRIFIALPEYNAL